MKRIPLTWLQAFEAAGRTGSFKAAAEELNVSPSNISHQIRDLEAYLGTLLFSRTGRSVVLTKEGQQYLPALADGFQRIREASLRSEPARNTLQIGAFPFLANEVITPNLVALKQVLGDVDVRLFTSTDLSSLTEIDPAHRLDVVIRYGDDSQRFAGYSAERLAAVGLVPIVARDAVHVGSVADLFTQPFIRVLGPFQGWELWLDQYAPEAELPPFSLETDSFHAAMLAVERGEGACLGVLPYIKPWIRANRVRALDEFMMSVDGQAAFAVVAPFQQHNPTIRKFLDWLTAQFE